MLMHGMEALAALHRISSHPTVLQRLLELLDILCARLALACVQGNRVTNLLSGLSALAAHNIEVRKDTAAADRRPNIAAGASSKAPLFLYL